MIVTGSCELAQFPIKTFADRIMSANTHQSGFRSYLTGRNGLAAFGTLLATLVVSIVVGPIGLLIAVGVGGTQYLVSGPMAFAVGQIVLMALYPAEGPTSHLVLGEVGLLCFLLSTALDHDGSIRMVMATLVAGGVVGGCAWLGLRTTDTVWIGGGMVIAATAVIAYGLHRYERVSLQLVETP